MTLSQFVLSIGNFDSWTHADKIRLFAWHIHTHLGAKAFATTDIVSCFDDLHLHRPSNASQFLRDLVDQKHFIKDGSGFRMAKSQRDAFDKRFGEREETIVIDKLLSELPGKVGLPAQQDYLREALICFRHKAFRAAIVMTWNLAYDHMVASVAARHLATFNAQLAGMFGGKKKPVSTKDDFQKLKESEVIEVCNASGILSKEISKIMSDKLDKRNSAAHPSGSTIDKLQAEAYIMDLITNAMLKM